MRVWRGKMQKEAGMNQSLFWEVQYIWFGISIFLLILLLLNQFPTFRDTIAARRLSARHQLIFIVLFSVMGVCGTYWNREAASGILNFRAVGIMLGGFLGGPLVGTMTGLAAGGFRAFFIHTSDPFIHGGLSVAQGVLAGFLSSYIKQRRPMWWSSLGSALFLEILFWLAFFLFAHPADPSDVAMHLALPILVTNSIGVALFVGVLENTIRGADTRMTRATKSAFDAVHFLFTAMKGGLTGEKLDQIAQGLLEALPSLSWTAVVYRGEVHTAARWQSEAEKARCEAEIAILRRQKSLPLMPHILSVPIQGRGEKAGEIFAAKSRLNPALYEKDSFLYVEKEFVSGMAQIMSGIYEYERLQQDKELLAEAEIRALQAQINPHFFYNTLNTISYYIRSDPDTARNLISYLSDYFRHSLSHPARQIPLSEEIHVISCYMKLEEARFGDRMKVTYRLPGKANIRIPPLLLQPLVENAVIHGVLPLPRGGHIQVGLLEGPSYFKLYVADDGVGIPRAKRRRLLEDGRERDRIGLINVHQRLLSLYGPESGLHIISRPGRGTIVYMKLPKEAVLLKKKEEV